MCARAHGFVNVFLRVVGIRVNGLTAQGKNGDNGRRQQRVVSLLSPQNKVVPLFSIRWTNGESLNGRIFYEFWTSSLVVLCKWLVKITFGGTH